jgi:hypothetical protein
MANEVIINLDKPRKIKFSMNALIAAANDIRKETKKPCTVQSVLQKFHNINQEDVEFEDLRFLAWVGLKHDDPTLTLHECGEIFDLKAFAEFGKIIADQFNYTFPKEDELPKKKVQSKKNLNLKPKKKNKKSS